MAYTIKQDEFPAPNGLKRTFYYRENTNDRDTIVGAFVEDEYGINDLEFEKGDIVVDVGAHIGAVTLLLSTMHPEIEIFSIEAHPKNFALLKRNIEVNKIENDIHIFCEAMDFYHDDHCRLFYGDSSRNGKIHKFIGSQFLHRSFYKPRNFKKVHTVNMSGFFEENRIIKCKFMKMDIEGAEYRVLKAAPAGVLEMIERIHGEYHNIDVEKISNPRELLLKQTKGVFADLTQGKSNKTIGPFVFIRKDLINAGSL